MRMSLEIRDFGELMEVVTNIFPDAEVYEDEDGIVCVNTGLVLQADETLIPIEETPEYTDGNEIESDTEYLEDLE